MIRKPAVAGMFYPAEQRALLAHLKTLWPHPAPSQRKALAAIVPHAGYIYSGRLAAKVYAQLAPAEIYVLLGPNHSGRGQPVAIAPETAWETPLGSVPIHQALSQALLQACPYAEADARAHQTEHCLEVQLPFLQQLGHAFSLVAVTLSTWDWKILQTLGLALAQTIRAFPSAILLLASSDMNHFENVSRTQELDQMALKPVLSLDPKGLLEIVQREDISMCGAAAVAAMLVAAKALGAVSAELVGHTTSAETSGDEESVVGYAGVIIQ